MYLKFLKNAFLYFELVRITIFFVFFFIAKIALIIRFLLLRVDISILLYIVEGVLEQNITLDISFVVDGHTSMQIVNCKYLKLGE